MTKGSTFTAIVSLFGSISRDMPFIAQLRLLGRGVVHNRRLRLSNKRVFLSAEAAYVPDF